MSGLAVEEPAAARVALDAWAAALRPLAPSGLAVELHVSDRVAGLDLPAPQAEALTRATLEALRNAWRHSGVTHAEVTVGPGPTRAHGGGPTVEVRVVDHGRGLPAHLEESFGLASSVRGSLAGVAGAATLGPSPGGGTTVTLVVPATETGHVGGTLARSHRLTMEAAGHDRMIIRAITVPMVLAWLFVALRHSWQGPWPTTTGLLLLAAAAAALTLGTGHRLERRPMTWPELAAVVAGSWGVQVGGLLLLPEGGLLDYRSWAVGFAVVPVMVCCFFLPVPVGLAAVASHVALVLGGQHLDPSLTRGAIPWGSLNAVVTTPLLAVGLGWLLRRTGAALETERTRLRAARAALRRRESAALVSSRHLEHTRTRILTWLEDVAAGVVDVDAPAARRRARLLGLEARDDLYAPGFFDPELRTAVTAFRGAGGSVQVRPGFDPGPATRLTGQVLGRLVAGLPDGARVAASPEPDAQRVRVAVLPPEAGAVPDLAALLSGLPVTLAGDDDRALVLIDLPGPDAAATPDPGRRTGPTDGTPTP